MLPMEIHYVTEPSLFKTDGFQIKVNIAVCIYLSQDFV